MAVKLSPQEARATAIRFFDAIQAGDVKTAHSVLAPNAKIWHNTDEIIVPRETTAKTLEGIHKFLTNVRYEDRKLDAWPGGFVEQHIFTGTRKADGGKVRLPACVICEVDGEGRITRLDEYFDSAAQNMFAGPAKQAKI
jgi:ketosteroid isomerase-like protein